jgi:3'-phosphoadenosine 5'-phosphosulfate sulfotransferase (PAPS reductase)/FAD synthetase
MAFKKKLLSIERHLLKKVSSAIIQYNLIDDKDKILIAHSGGKDSWALLHFLHLVKQFAPISFDYGIILLNQGIDSSIYYDILDKIKKIIPTKFFFKKPIFLTLFAKKYILKIRSLALCVAD